MRSSIITLVLLLSIGVSWAGDRNRIIALGVRNFTYTPKEGKEYKNTPAWQCPAGDFS